MTAVIVNYTERSHFQRLNQMLAIVVVGLLVSSPLAQCQPARISTSTSWPSQHEHLLHSRPSLRDLFFSGLFLLRPSLMEPHYQTIDMRAVPEIESNEIPIAEPSTSTSTAPPPPSPPPSASVIARFNALKHRLSLEKAILPPIQMLEQVSSDRIVKKIDYTAPRMVDTMPELVMTE